eukprot:CAMPEP_0176154690 /NCGR_PEP_ID=MMETSP0120_2-20121206/79029_1 /TAXON_ID=160619 /ORGANISM="Kryptoperidinium foliaceum, Strain CCMP 1326" /LENGTH=56 /DNA_ID=CAMNT_0017491791 /DNA_START=63 /DNA_END=230 /DNA_ORIENTATION=-
MSDEAQFPSPFDIENSGQSLSEFFDNNVFWSKKDEENDEKKNDDNDEEDEGEALNR